MSPFCPYTSGEVWDNVLRKQFASFYREKVKTFLVHDIGGFAYRK